MREYRSRSLNENSEQSANNQVRTEIFACQTVCRAFFERNPIFFYLLFLGQSFSLRRLLHGVYTVPLARYNVRSLTNVISVHTLERLLML